MAGELEVLPLGTIIPDQLKRLEITATPSVHTHFL